MRDWRWGYEQCGEGMNKWYNQCKNVIFETCFPIWIGTFFYFKEFVFLNKIFLKKIDVESNIRYYRTHPQQREITSYNINEDKNSLTNFFLINIFLKSVKRETQ